MRRRDCSRHRGAGHGAHHRQGREQLPQRSFFSGRRIPPLPPAVSCLGGGVSATNSFKIPSPPLSLQRCARKIPAPSHPCASRCHPTVPASPRPRRAAAPGAASSPSSTGGSWGETGALLGAPQGRTPLFPRRTLPAAPESGSARRRQGGQGAEGTNPKPSASSPGQALRTREQIYNEQFLNWGAPCSRQLPNSLFVPTFCRGSDVF